MYASSSSRTESELVSSYRRWTCATMPSHALSAAAFFAAALAAGFAAFLTALRGAAGASPTPCSNCCRTLTGIFPHGRLRSKPSALASPGRMTLRRYPSGSPHGSTTPSRIEMLGSPSTSASLTERVVPSPLQVSHAPKGELNEKCRGSSSGIEMPQVGHPYRSENISVCGSAAS
jgi:hypothetical protein